MTDVSFFWGGESICAERAVVIVSILCQLLPGAAHLSGLCALLYQSTSALAFYHQTVDFLHKIFFNP